MCVLNGGRSQVVIAVGIHQLAGGIDGAVEQAADGVDAALAHFAHPHAGVNAVVHAADIGVEEVQLNGVGGVEEDDDLADLAAGLALAQGLEEVLLLLAQLQDVSAAVPCAVPGQIGAFAADAAQHYDCGVAIVSHGIPLGLGVNALGNFADQESGVLKDIVVQRTGGSHQTVVLARAGGVEVPQGGIDGKAVGFQGVLQVDGGGGVHSAGTGAAVDEVGSGGTKKAHLGAFRQRQGVVPVEQQGGAVGHDLFTQLFGGSGLLLAGGVIGFIVDLARVAHHLGGLGAQHHVDDGGVAVGNGSPHHADCKQYRGSTGQDLPL